MSARREVVVNTEDFHRTDENEWNFEYLLQLCKFFSPPECKLLNHVFAINLFCDALYAQESSLFNKRWVYVAQKKLIGWKHRMDVFWWIYNQAHLGFCRNLDYGAAT